MTVPAPNELIIAITQQFVSCPACRHTTSVKDIKPLDGAVVICKHCGARLALRVQPPRQGT